MNVPKLRFKGFQDAWEVHKFSEKFTFHNTNSYSRALLAEQGSIMNIHYGDIHTKFSALFDVAKEDVPFLSCKVDTQKIATNQFLQVKDLIIADASEDYKDIGKTIEVVNLNNQKAVAGLHTYIARPNSPSALGFNSYLMQTFKVREQIQKLATGISVLGISKGNLGNVELNIPCLQEQTKIASFLSAVDDKIAALRQEHDLWQQYKQGMMQQLFSQKLRFQDDNGQDFPDWKTTIFSEKFTFHQTNSYSRALLSEQGEIMNIHYGDIHTKFSSLFDATKEKVPFLSAEVEISKLDEERFLRVGDLVIADASEDYKDIGKTIEIVNLGNQKLVAGLHTYIARPKQDFALGFHGYLMQTLAVRAQIQKLATGISVLGISKTNLGKVEIKIPTLAEQTKIAACLSSIDAKIDALAQQLEQARVWKQGLLQQMFV
ncbi:putative type 1 restriction endonuclease HsdS [Vitreoscilla sp. C1]|uniref:restriction endonuclease subunit S n=1 Tax=Vitreoscilla sp. (strain C1) TaxID=96942 RepID=UPI00148EBC48|nr:restriction endonuclease subunit S [Vitreoscilla sp. C1]AUZ05290.2 putative type 1 restriction endonuclease HsdS [Vitreoscilla sp. C1]